MQQEELQLQSEIFWHFLIKFVKTSRPKFSFTNIDFKYKTFTGEEKFPIQFWNSAMPDTKDKLLASVESHWQLAQYYEQSEKTSFSSDVFLENVIKINHGKEKISSLFQKRMAEKVKHKSHNVQEFSNHDENDIDPNRYNLPMAMRYRKHKENGKKVEVGASKIHCQGLFAMEHFSQGDIVIEYVGEVIDNKEADRREKQYEKSGMSD
jgi:hypothetical protein